MDTSSTLGAVTDSGQLIKMEVDYSATCDEKLPVYRQLAADGRLDDALAGLLALEKQTRTGADMHSTSRVLVAIVQICFNAGDYQRLNEHIVALAKRRSQLKQSVAKMVQEACQYVDQLSEQRPQQIKLIDTLRTVTEGKIYVEVERARLTHKLAMMRESEGDVQTAATILQELQVETYGSMERTEKVTLILEQMRLCLLREDYIRTQIIAKKINIKFFEEPSACQLKLKYYRLMIDLEHHLGTSLAICKHYLSIYRTPSIQESAADSLSALRHAVLYLVLASHDNERSDLMHRLLATEKRLDTVFVYRDLLRLFTNSELIQWRHLCGEYERPLRVGPAADQSPATGVFDASTSQGQERWQKLQQRVVEHNIGVLARYYRRIRLCRMAQLLDMASADAAEQALSQMVVSGAVWAKTDRLTGVVSFVKPQQPTDVLSDWSRSVDTLMSLVNKTTHLINKEEMVHKHLVAAPSVPSAVDV